MSWTLLSSPEQYKKWAKHITYLKKKNVVLEGGLNFQINQT